MNVLRRLVGEMVSLEINLIKKQKRACERCRIMVFCARASRNHYSVPFV